MIGRLSIVDIRSIIILRLHIIYLLNLLRMGRVIRSLDYWLRLLISLWRIKSLLGVREMFCLRWRFMDRFIFIILLFKILIRGLSIKGSIRNYLFAYASYSIILFKYSFWFFLCLGLFLNYIFLFFN